MSIAKPGTALPNLSIPLVGGDTRALGPDAQWHLLVVYRGRHCPRCKTYLTKLDGLQPDFAERGVTITVTSADPEDRAVSDRDEFGWTFPLGHSLSLSDMAALGLYVSDPRSEAETDRPFAEPGLFLTNGDGLIHVMSTSNSASVRPDLDVVLDGVKGIQNNGLPIRGLRGQD